MNNFKARNTIKGMTLLEIMLVLAIATSIILAGISMYQTADRDKNYFFLRANVDMLFQAMKNYYYTQCDLRFDQEGLIRGKGALTFNPTSNPTNPVLTIVPFDIRTVNNYITQPWPRYLPIVASNNAAEVYFAQFNPSPAKLKQNYVCSNYTRTGTTECSTPTAIPAGQIILWQSQIAVKMQDPTTTTYFLALAGADCAVNSISTTTAVNCTTDAVPIGGRAQYMVWQRMPSFSSPNIQSSLWISNPRSKKFKLQYTHDPLYELYNTNAVQEDLYQYYNCGG